VEKWKNLLQIPYKPPSIVFSNSKERGLAYYQKYDVYASMILYTSLKQYLQPLLSTTEIIPLWHSLPEKLFGFFENCDRWIDVYMSGAGHPQWYPLRNFIEKVLPFETSFNSVISKECGNSSKLKILQSYSDVREQIQKYEEQMLFYADKIRCSKIMIFDGGLFDYPVKKYFEAMACGALVLAPLPIDADLLGFADDKNMVVIDETNFIEKIKYYLEHEKERNHIVENAYQLYQERYTCRKSVEIFMKKINQIRNEREKRD
jgi:glycosyltransferase involved in cell wall biosynthesis